MWERDSTCKWGECVSQCVYVSVRERESEGERARETHVCLHLDHQGVCDFSPGVSGDHLEREFREPT